MWRLSWNLGASTSWNPQGLSRTVMGLFYLFLYIYLRVPLYICQKFRSILPKCTKTKAKPIYIYIYIYTHFLRNFSWFYLGLLFIRSNITVFPFIEATFRKQSFFAYRMKNSPFFFVRYLALRLTSIIKFNSSNIGEERILWLKSLISYSASLYCAYILKHPNQNTTQNYHCIQHHFSAIRIFSNDTIIKCKPLQVYITK